MKNKDIQNYSIINTTFMLRKISVMKNLLILLCIVISMTNSVKAQAKLGLDTTYSFSPNDTVLMNSQVTLNIIVKNKGNATFTGTFSVNAKLDTLNGVFCGSTTYGPVTILPNGSVPASVNFTPTTSSPSSLTPIGFKVAGNGNTIVVWPISNVQITDSLRSFLYINGTVGLKEFQKSILAIYPNPTSSNISILQAPNNVFKQIEIYDMFGRKIKDLSFAQTIDVSELSNGCYMLHIIADDKVYRTLFVKE